MSASSYFQARERSGADTSPAKALGNLFSNADLGPDVRSHLVSVYSTLSIAVVAAAAGSYAHLLTGAGGLLTTLASLGMMMWLHAERAGGDNQKRTAILGGFAFFQGLSIGPLIALAAHVDPSLIVTAFVGTAAVFLCFTASALTAKRQTYLALGGLLGSGLSLMMVLSFANIFFRSVAVYQAHLYLGLLVFSGFVLYDTQLIILRAQAGDRDHVWHAMELFIDAVAIFVRVLVILLQNAGDKKEKKRSSRR